MLECPPVSGFRPWAPPSAIRGAAGGEDAGVAACKRVSSAMGASLGRSRRRWRSRCGSGREGSGGRRGALTEPVTTSLTHEWAGEASGELCGTREEKCLRRTKHEREAAVPRTQYAMQVGFF